MQSNQGIVGPVIVGPSCNKGFSKEVSHDATILTVTNSTQPTRQ